MSEANNSDLLCVRGSIEPIETVYAMSNDELAAAIKQTHWYTRNTKPTSENYKEYIEHLKCLLELQRLRAKTIKAVNT